MITKHSVFETKIQNGSFSLQNSPLFFLLEEVDNEIVPNPWPCKMDKINRLLINTRYECDNEKRDYI